MKEKRPPRRPLCDSCGKRVSIVFLTDSSGPIFNMISQEDQVVLAVIGATTEDLPDTKPYSDEKCVWKCEICLGRDHGTNQ